MKLSFSCFHWLYVSVLGARNNFRFPNKMLLLPTKPLLFEILMHKNLVSFLDTNNIITKHQFGFRSGLSILLALNQLHNYILRLNDSGQYTCGIFRDFKKAFDTVNYKILLDKLNHHGIRGLALDFSHHIERINSNLFLQMEFSLIRCKSLVVCRKVRLLDLCYFYCILIIAPCLPFFLIFLLMIQHYLFLIPIPTIWRKN